MDSVYNEKAPHQTDKVLLLILLYKTLEVIKLSIFYI